MVDEVVGGDEAVCVDCVTVAAGAATSTFVPVVLAGATLDTGVVATVGSTEVADADVVVDDGVNFAIASK